MAPILVKIAIPFVSAAAVGAVKYLLAQYGSQIPSWLKPVLAAMVGAAAGALTGDPSALAEAAAEGAALGGGAPMVRETFTAIRDKAAGFTPAGTD